MERHKQWKDALALQLRAELHFSAGACWYLLVAAGPDFIERKTPKTFLWYSGWFWPLLWLLLIWWSLAVSIVLSCHSWFMFGVCYWSGLLVSWQWRVESPKKLILVGQNTLSLLTFFSPYLWLVEGKLRHLRTLSKVGFEKNLSL